MLISSLMVAIRGFFSDRINSSRFQVRTSWNLLSLPIGYRRNLQPIYTTSREGNLYSLLIDSRANRTGSFSFCVHSSYPKGSWKFAPARNTYSCSTLLISVSSFFYSPFLKLNILNDLECLPCLAFVLLLPFKIYLPTRKPSTDPLLQSQLWTWNFIDDQLKHQLKHLRSFPIGLHHQH